MGGEDESWIRSIGKHVPLARWNIVLALLVSVALVIGFVRFDWWMIRSAYAYVSLEKSHPFRNGAIDLRKVTEVRSLNELYVDAPEHECRATWKSTNMFETNCAKSIQKLQKTLADKKTALLLGGFSATIQMKDFATVATMLKDLPISMGDFIDTRFVSYELPCTDKKACLPEATMQQWQQMPTMADRYTEYHVAVLQNNTLFIDHMRYGRALIDIANSSFWDVIIVMGTVIFHIVIAALGIVFFSFCMMFLDTRYREHALMLERCYRTGGLRALVGYVVCQLFIFPYQEVVALEMKRDEESRRSLVSNFRAAFLENYDRDDAFLCFPDAWFRGCNVRDLKRIEHVAQTNKRIAISAEDPTILFVPPPYYELMKNALTSAREVLAPKPAPVPDAAQ